HPRAASARRDAANDSFFMKSPSRRALTRPRRGMLRGVWHRTCTPISMLRGRAIFIAALFVSLCANGADTKGGNADKAHHPKSEAAAKSSTKSTKKKTARKKKTVQARTRMVPPKPRIVFSVEDANDAAQTPILTLHAEGSAVLRAQVLL